MAQSKDNIVPPTPARPMMHGPLTRHAGALAAAAALALWAALVGAWCLLGRVNADEGFYVLSSLRASTGSVPYRDFGYTQMPLLPYLNIPWHALFGFTVAGGRCASFAWTLAGGLLLMAGMARLHGRAAGAWALLLLALSGFTAACFLGLAKTHAPVAFLLLACGLLPIFRIPARAAWWLAVLAGTLAIGVRLTAAPCVAVLWLGHAVTRRSCLRPADLAAVILLPLALIEPFYLAAPGNALFWTFDFHVLSTINRHAAHFLMEDAHFLYGLIPISAVACAAAWRARRTADSRLRTAFAGGWAGIICSVVVAGNYGEYLVPFMGVAMFGAAGILWEAEGGLVRPAAPLLCVLGLVASNAGGRFTNSPLQRQMFTGPRLDDLGAASAFLAANTAPDDVVIGSMVEVALGAGRTVAPGFEMGKFSVTDEMSEGRAEALHMVHRNALLRRIGAGEADALVLSDGMLWNFGWSVPGYRIIEPAAYNTFIRTINSRYRVTYSDPPFLILLRKPGGREGGGGSPQPVSP